MDVSRKSQQEKEEIHAVEKADQKLLAAPREEVPPFVDTCIEHGPGGVLRLSFQVRVF